MSLDVAKQGVDFALSQPKRFDAINWEFIGGEPFMEIELIDQITDYIIAKQKDHAYGSNFIINFTTNGTLFSEPKVKEYLTKDVCKKSVGLSLDGCKEIHDFNRCDSFDSIMENFQWWRRVYPWGRTKSTLNHESLPYIYESLRFMIDDLGLTDIFMNTVFEDVWQPGDAELYYEQLIKVADFLIDNRRYERYYISLFDEFLIGDGILGPQGWCGCGNSMLAIDYQGLLYPCLRFNSLSKQPLWVIGDIWNGIDPNRLKTFKFCHHLRSSECNDCDVKAGCGWCVAFNYDETGSIFEKVTYMCEMHKARVKANRYFFERISG
jgi:uncharacterized protein